MACFFVLALIDFLRTGAILILIMETLSPTRLVPILPIRNTVVFPGNNVPLRVGRVQSIAAIEKAMKESPQWIFIVTQKNEQEEEPGPDQLYSVGTLCKIEKASGSLKKGYQIIVQGHYRFQSTGMQVMDGVLQSYGEILKDDEEGDESAFPALAAGIKKLAKDILNFFTFDSKQVAQLIDSIQDLTVLTYLCAQHLNIETQKKQTLLENNSPKARALQALDFMQSLKNSLDLQQEIQGKVSKKLGGRQREALLREQMRAIQEELGETDGSEQIQSDYRKKIEDAKIPEAAEKIAFEELKRLEAMGPQSAESHVIRNYLDMMIALPWKKSSESEINLTSAREILEKDHYGLDKIKKRILQHLAVMKLKKDVKGSILLLVGPPGVGKTSLGQSIAKTLGRKFVRASLGGIRDDAEIRGHRRTYIGAMPGRIIQSIKRAGENNPVMLLDEIDKLSRSFGGDPSSALLEVLDPEQNSAFLDHYLDTPFDLSNVFFIATANSLETIPAPLLDRMEVVELSGYTVPEKFHIAKSHLIPKQLSEFGLSAQQIEFSEEALLRVITHFTRESGVRDLQRKIATALRASIEKVLDVKKEELPVQIVLNELENLLGPERYIHEVAESVASPGVVTGLAWTPVGGEILLIESRSMPGKGQLILTGQLGDVMRESAQIALSLVRSNLAALAPQFDYDKKDIHIHVPSGAIPKDGPSAGIALVTSLASLVLGRSVNPKLAMSGEITLRGAVMPVGGIKEKVIAAHRAGVERVILSVRNEKDLIDVPDEVKSQMKFEFVSSVSEVLKLALFVEPAQIPGLSLYTIESGSEKSESRIPRAVLN